VANVELATAYIALVPSMRDAQGKITESLVPAGNAAGDKAGKAAGGTFAAGFAGVAGAAAVGAAAVGAAVGGAAVGLYKVGAVFDDVTDSIRVGTGTSGAALDGLVDVAQQVATSVPTSFQAAGDTVAALNQRLGLSGDTLSTVSQQYIQAGNILGQTVDVDATTAAFNAFGIEGTKVEGAMDTLFRVSQATGVGMNELAAQVQTSAAPLQNLGFSFEQTAALAGTLDKAGLNTSQVMGSMSKALVTLAKDGEEPQAAFKRVTGEIQGFVSAGDTAGALDLASKVFGTKGAAQFVGAIQSGKVNLDDLSAAAAGSGDTILGLGKETADAAENWQLVKNKALLALEPIGSAVFDLAGKGMGFLADNMDGVIAKISAFGSGIGGVVSLLATGDFKGPIFGMEEDSGFVDFLFSVREMALSMAPVFSQVFGAVGQIFGQLGPVFAQLLPQLFQLWQAFSPLTLIFTALGPMLPQIVGLFGTLATSLGGALTQALASLMPTFLQLSTLLSGTLAGVFLAVMPAVLDMVGMLAGLFTQLAPVIAQIVGVVGQLVTQLLASLAPILMQLIATVMPMVVEIFGAVTSAVLPLVQMLAGLLIPIIQALMPVVTTVFGVIAQIIGTVMQIVMGIIQVVTGIISGNWSQVWEGIVNIFSGIWNTIVALVTGALQIVWSIITSVFGLVWGFISDTLGNIGRFFSDTWNNIVNWVTGAVGKIWSGILMYIGMAKEFIEGTLANIGNFFRDTWDNIIRGVSGFMDNFLQFFRDLPGKIGEFLKGAGTWLLDTGKNLIDGLVAGVQNMAGSVAKAILNVLPEAIRGPIETVLGIRSPSTVAMWWMEMIGEGFLKQAPRESRRMQAALDGLVTIGGPGVPGGTSATFRAAGNGSATQLHIHGNVYGDPEHIVDAMESRKRRAATLANLSAITAGG
jgi:TP901 family phage tail tape measure protein